MSCYSRKLTLRFVIRNCFSLGRGEMDMYVNRMVRFHLPQSMHSCLRSLQLCYCNDTFLGITCTLHRVFSQLYIGVWTCVEQPFSHRHICSVIGSPLMTQNLVLCCVGLSILSSFWILFVFRSERVGGRSCPRCSTGCLPAGVPPGTEAELERRRGWEFVTQESCVWLCASTRHLYICCMYM